MDMSKQNHSSYRTDRRRLINRFSSHSGTIIFLGLVLIGFLISWLFGGFPSVLLPSFLFLAIGITIDLFSTICKSGPKEEPSEHISTFRGILIIVSFYLIFAWCFGMLMPCFQGPNINKILRRVEYPFSEVSHVVADSKGAIYTYSQFNKRVQKYSKYGRFQFGWFGAHPTQKNAAMAIDENDHIYIYWDWIVRKYDSNGNMISEICKSRDDRGWWRLIKGSVVWEPNGREPEQYDEYNKVVKNGDSLPGTELRKSGFKTTDAKYYRFTRLWFLFPVVSVDRYLSRFEHYVMPNPISLIFTFVFPGFLFYAFALFLAWVMEKPAERLKKPFLLKAAITAFILAIAVAAIVIGSKIVISIANVLPASNSLHFWLVPVLVIPYWIIVVVATLWVLRSLLRRLKKSAPLIVDNIKT